MLGTFIIFFYLSTSLIFSSLPSTPTFTIPHSYTFYLKQCTLPLLSVNIPPVRIREQTKLFDKFRRFSIIKKNTTTLELRTPIDIRISREIYTRNFALSYIVVSLKKIKRRTQQLGFLSTKRYRAIYRIILPLEVSPRTL